MELLQNKADQFHQLQQSANIAQQEINSEKARLTADFKNLSAEFERINKLQIDLPELQKKIETLNEKLTQAETQLTQRDAVQSKLEELQNLFSTKQSELKQTTLTHKNLREQYQDFHQAGPECPFCNQPLTPEHRQKYEEHLTVIGQELKEQKIRLESEVSTIQAEIKEYRDNLQNLNRVQQDYNQIQNQRTAFLTQNAQIQETIDIWQNTKAEYFKEVTQKLETEDFAKKARLTLTELNEQINSLGYDFEKHQNLKELESALRGSEIQLPRP